MSSKTDPIPPVPQHTPPITEQGVGLKRFTNDWMQWFVLVRDKINVINNSLVNIASLVGQGFAVKDNSGNWYVRVIRGTVDQINVTNGDGVAGDPTAALAPVTDVGGGTLQKTAFDAFGRKTGTSASTTTDLAEGTNLYHTAARVLATLLTGLSTATNAVITAADSVLAAIGKLQAQITANLSTLSGLVIDSIADADTTHAPSRNAVFDALAGKEPTIASGTTAQFWRGDKTWSNTLESASFPVMFWRATGNATDAKLANMFVDTAGDLVFGVVNDANTVVYGAIVVRRSGNVTPASDNTHSCGSATNRWSVLYASKGIFSGPVRLQGYTVATLPAGTQGDKAFVTDALAPTYLVTVAGGGAVVTEVFYNGTTWVCT